jgi:hypothetical protein
MNTRQLAILAVLAAVSVGATAAVLRTSTAGIASDRRGERVLPGLIDKANQITGVVVRQGNDTLAIERRDAGFVAADSGFPVKADTVRDLIASSIELSFEEARTSDPARYPDLGLADPGAAADAGKEITLRAAGGNLADFVVGNRDNTVGGAVGGEFVRLEGQPQTWLVRGNVRLPANRSDWFAGLDLGLKGDEVKKIEVSGGGRDGVTAAASADKPGALTLENVPEKRVADTFKVGRLATLIGSFAFQDVRKRSKPADDARHLVADFGDGLRLTVTAVGEPTEGWVQVSAEATNDAARAKADAIAAKVGLYDFRLPADRAELLGWTNTELTTEQKG